MPLIEMSPNVQEAEGTRKRSHDEYAAEDVASKAGSDGAANPNSIHNRLGISPETPDDNHGMSDGSTLSPTRTPSPSPSSADKPSPATTSLPAHPKPDNPAKRKRLTPAEKAAKADEEAKKKKEREESRQQKAAEKAAEKARIEKEKAEAKAARQAEKARREEAEQEAKAAKQQEREDKKRKKDEEERKAREEKERKERSQLKLQSFFKKPTTPKKAAPAAVEEKVSPKKGSSPRKEKTAYERMFQPFFVKQHVRVARQRPWLDDEAAEAKTRILDEYVSGERAPADVAPFNPLEALQVPAKPRREGRTHPSVRAVMDELQENPAALEKLRRVPVKLICFRQDVRPPYCGTLTAIPQGGELRLRRAARNPNGRVMELQYDYDSEAEWQDDEPGDDLDDLDDEEEEADDEDDMDGFLDDSEDAGVARRIFANEMEPESTGVCWDGDEGAAKLKPYRMEVMLENIDHSAGIDPFSTQYWSPPKKMPPPASTSQPPASKLSNPNSNSNPANPPDDLKAQIKNPELIPEFKEAVLANRKLSKLAIVEVLGLQFEGLSKAQTKAMLEYVAERGHGKGKVWELKAGI